MFRNATTTDDIYLSEIIVVCKVINVQLKYIGYFGKKNRFFIPGDETLLMLHAGVKGCEGRGPDSPR